ncbi:hypothetical protein BDR22DRAFT_832467, partial [Usnea florida]
MYVLKKLGTITVLGTLFATTAAAPAPAVDTTLVANSLGTRDVETDHLADVNMYTGSTCNANTRLVVAQGLGERSRTRAAFLAAMAPLAFSA